MTAPSHRLTIELELFHDTDDDAQDVLEALIETLGSLSPLTNADPTGGTAVPHTGESALDRRSVEGVPA